MTTADLSIGPEIMQRQKWLKLNATPHLRKMLKDQSISIERRRYLLMTLALTAILYGSNTWPVLTSKEQKAFHVLLMRAYRYVVPAAYTGTRHL